MITRDEIKRERQLKGFCTCKKCIDDDMRQSDFEENFLNLMGKYRNEIDISDIKVIAGDQIVSFSLGEPALFKTIKKGDIISIDLQGKKFKVKVKRKIKKGEELVVESVYE